MTNPQRLDPSTRPLPPLPLATLIGRELRGERSEKPSLRYGHVGLAKRGEDLFLIEPNCVQIAGDPSTSFSVFVHAIGAKDRIRESLQKVELSVSSYDTAWVAIVPSPRSLELPCFPECVDWILDNQCPNGSWGHLHTHPFLTKDTLSSTLACILALQTWNVGEEHVNKGLQYIGSNLSSTVNMKMLTPIGFDIIFPSMICHALEMGLDLPINTNEIDTLRQIRDLELKKGPGDYTEGTKAYHAYLAEGLRESQNWKQVMMFQKKNGSLFNSPSATAAALIHTQDEKSLNYLCSLVQKFGSAVPTIDIFTHLSIVDKLERFGISQHFSSDIKNILDMVYR